MKVTPFSPALICLGVLACTLTFAQETNKTSGSGTINFVNVPPDKILDVYQDTTGEKLVVASTVRQANHNITLHFHGSTAEISRSIEQALLKQAGIVITHLDDKLTSVTYNDNLKLQP